MTQLNTPLKRSIWAVIKNRRIDTNIQRHVRRTGEVCFWCGGALKPGKTEADHVIPRSKKGADRLANLVPSCSSCNQKKHNKDPLVFADVVGKDLNQVAYVLSHARKVESRKRVTVFRLESFGLDAYVFIGFDRDLIRDGRNYRDVSFHVLNNGFRAFTAEPMMRDAMLCIFDDHQYDVIDRTD